jgi:hypothetical protein
MRMRTPLLAGALWLVSATPAFACNFYFASTFMKMPARPSFGLGVEATFSDPTLTALSGDVAMRLGNNMIVQPGIGVCFSSDDTESFFGAGFAYKLTQSGTMTLNLQSGLAYMPLDGGSRMTIPVGLAASFAGTGAMGFYAGASLWFQQFDIDDFGSETETDPVLFGGLQSRSGSLGWSLGGQLYMGSDTEFALIAGVQMNQGASAIRNLPKLFKK